MSIACRATVAVIFECDGARLQRFGQYLAMHAPILHGIHQRNQEMERAHQKSLRYLAYIDAFPLNKISLEKPSHFIYHAALLTYETQPNSNASK